MSLGIELNKFRRTGLYPAYLTGACFAALIPILNMAARTESLVGQPGHPIGILLHSNWQMIAMINLLLVIIGTCISYHIEYENLAMRKIQTLPVKAFRIFFTKAVLLLLLMTGVLLVEIAAVGFCAVYWFPLYSELVKELLCNYLIMLLLHLPVILVSLNLAECFENMWISLGIGVVGLFFGTIVITKGFAWAFVPYVMPFYTFESIQISQTIPLLGGALVIIIGLVVIQLIIIRLRRCFS